MDIYEQLDFWINHLLEENRQMRRELDALERQASWQPIPPTMRHCGLSALAVRLGKDEYGQTIYMRTFGYQAHGVWYDVHNMLIYPIAYIPIADYHGECDASNLTEVACG